MKLLISILGVKSLQLMKMIASKLFQRLLKFQELSWLLGTIKCPVKKLGLIDIIFFKRDKSQCQYCGQSLPKSELTIDHIVPRALGGKTEWENVVCACSKCNRKKGCKTLAASNMKLKVKPVKPSWELLSNLYIKTTTYKEWRPFLSFIEASYWNVELEE